MIALARIVVQLLADLAGLVVLLLRPRRSVAAENLFLRRQLALYLERGAKPRRVDAATRVSLTVLSRLFDWRDALVVVRPETLIRWHRAGWRLFRRMATENPLWGEERIANELLLKLGLRVSPRTVRKYMPKRPPGRPRGDQRWATFLRNHADAIVACDFFVAVTATFRLRHGPCSSCGRSLDLTVLKSPPHSPQANAICERVIGTIRRECLDWLIPPSDRRAPQRARPIGAGWLASRISAGARVGVIG